MHWIVLVLLAEFVFGWYGTFAAFAMVVLALSAFGVAVFRGKVNLSAWLERMKNPKIRRRMSTFEIFFVEEVSEVFETALPSAIFALFLGIWFSLAWVFAEGSSSNIIVLAQMLWATLWKAWSGAELSHVWKEFPIGILAHKLVIFGFLVRQFYKVEAVHKAVLIVAGHILEKDRLPGLRSGKLPFFTEVFDPFTGPQLLILSHKEPLKDAEGNPIKIVSLGEHKEERFVGDIQVAITDSDGKIKGEKEYGDLRVALQYHVSESDIYYSVKDAEKDFLSSFVPASIRALALKGHGSLIEFFGMALEKVNSDIGETLKTRFKSWGLVIDAIEIQDADSIADVKKEEIQARAQKEKAKGTLAEGTAAAQVKNLEFAAFEAGKTKGFITGVLDSMPADARNKITPDQIIDLGLKSKTAEALAASKPTVVLGGDSLLSAGVTALAAASGVVSPSSSAPAPKS